MRIAAIGTAKTQGTRAGQLDDIFIAIDFNGRNYSVYAYDSRVPLEEYAKNIEQAFEIAKQHMAKMEAHYGEALGWVLFDYSVKTINLPANYTPSEKQAQYARDLGAKIGVDGIDYTAYTIDQLKGAIDHIRKGGIVKFNQPVADTPVADTPVADTPVADTPVADTPVADTKQHAKN